MSIPDAPRYVVLCRSYRCVIPYVFMWLRRTLIHADSFSRTRNAVALEPRDQRAARDSEPPRGLRLVAAARRERTEDPRALERIDALV